MEPNEFIALIAALTQDGECSSCKVIGHDLNTECKDHQPFFMSEDDALQTVNRLINQARLIHSRLA